ncbi:MAG: chemotaxis protein CheW [Candidatus Hydrogenedentota bacterium]
MLLSGFATCLVFDVAGEKYALPVELVEEVLPSLPVEPMRQGPPWLRGVIYVRGHLIPVLDVARMLEIPRETSPVDPHIIAVKVPSGGCVGLEVDAADGLLDIALDAASWSADSSAGRSPLGRVVEVEGVLYRFIRPEFLEQDLAPSGAAALSVGASR